MKSPFEFFQPLGRALMLPIAVLPAAGLLLRLGQPDLLNIAFIAAAGDAIFSNLGLLFAAGVAVGLAKENHGAAALAGIVAYFVTTKGASVLMHVPPSELANFAGDAARGLAADAFKAKAIGKLSVPIGIFSGLLAGWLYNRYYTIKLPEYLAFFSGRRFVPIAAGFLALVPAAAVGFGWPSIESAMDSASHAILGAGGVGLFAYGVLNRLLIVTGLHHIINNIAWFILGDYHGVTGDLKRFFAGDPTAGKFMSGFFPVMMFGLPAACLAIYHAAKRERRKEIAGLLASMALTAFLTGVTEPIEFSFMFLAPALYAIHAVLTGLGMVLMDALGIRLGFGFSAGFFDYVINFGKATRPLWLLPIGAVYFAVYYGTFRFAIARFNLKTLGREDEAPAVAQAAVPAGERGASFVEALGGASNIESVDACTTRLRLVLKSSAAVNEPALKVLGARGVVRPSANAFQVVVGPIADGVATEIRAALSVMAASSVRAVSPQPADTASPIAAPAAPAVDIRALLAALGGAANILKVETCSTRLRITVAEPQAVDAARLHQVGARAIALPRPANIHVLIGPAAAKVADDLRALQSAA